jgi:hypothetical protein
MAKQRVTLYISPMVWRRLRIRALREGTSASAIVEGLIERELQESPERSNDSQHDSHEDAEEQKGRAD